MSDQNKPAFQFGLARLMVFVTLFCIAVTLFLLPLPGEGATNLSFMLFFSTKIAAAATLGFAIGNLFRKPLRGMVIGAIVLLLGWFAIATYYATIMTAHHDFRRPPTMELIRISN